MKIKFKCGFNCSNVDFDNGEKEIEVEKFDLKDVLKKYLVMEFGSVEECVKYWSESFKVINEGEGMDEIVNYILEMKECDVENEMWEGDWMVSEEGYVKIFVDGKLFLG